MTLLSDRLDPKRTLVVVVDIQERLAPAMPPAQLEAVTRSATILLEGAALLGAGVVATEQYPKGLGATLPAIADKLAAIGAPRLEKVEFSAVGVRAFDDALAAFAPRSVVVIGMETHVCVYQTVRGLAAKGFDVHVPIDGVASRRDDHRDAGLALCERAGAFRTTTESVVFDWLERAGSDAFKALSKLIR